MDPANALEAVREAKLDADEGADIVMVKPALPYLDIIRRVKDATGMPVAAYNVSGEYAMIKAAAAQGLLDERAAVLEALTGIRRAGADIVITYHAKDVARWLVARAKVRSRRDGSAVPLDETDKKLLNLMQGSFALRPDPFAGVAELAGIPEDEVMERVQYLLDKRIIREITPIFDTRALGYSSMLVAAKVDAEQPAPGGAVHQLAPGRHAQLPAQPRVQPLVHARGRAGLQARPRRHARRDGGQDRRRVDPPAPDAEAVQDPHGPRDGGRHRRAQDRRRGGRADGARPDRAPELDIAVIKATQGPMEVRSDAYTPAAERLGAARRRTCSRAWSPCASAAACAAWPRSSTTAARASPPTAWACGRCRTARSSTPAAGWRPSAASSTATSARPTRTGRTRVFTMAHGRSKEECDAVLDAIAEATGIERARDAVLEHRVQEGPDALLHRRLQALGRGARVLSSLVALGHALGRALPARAARPAGRGQLAGAGDAGDRPRPDLHRARRAAPS